MREYLTVCRATQFLPLLRSMVRHCTPFYLHVLNWDWSPDIFAGRLPYGDFDIEFWPRAEVENIHPRLREPPGPPRRTINLIDTARWHLMRTILARGEAGPITYIDGDQWFWSSPEPVYAEIGAARLAVSPHRIPEKSAGLPGVSLETHRRYGLFNSGACFVADAAIAAEMADALHLWSYCEPTKLPDGSWLFGDQGALERVAMRVGAHVIQHPGFNVGPWNIHRHRITRAHDGAVFVDGSPLVTYHFSGLQFGGRLAGPQYAITPEHERILYHPYLRALAESA